MKHLWHNDKGLVMMEAVIAMPLYLLLFLSPIWLGQLALDRTRLTQVERSYAMLKDTVGVGALKEMLYRETDFFSIANHSPEDTSDDSLWWKKSQSRLELTQKLPSFLGGLVYLGSYVFETPGSTLTEDKQMASQGEPTATVATSVAYIRNTSVVRSGLTNLFNADAVNTMVNAAYVASQIGDDEPGLTTMESYTRNEKLKEWSE